MSTAQDVDLQSLVTRVVRELSAELRPGARGVTVHPTSELDRDLGFDSLSRVELLARLEAAASVRLPDRVALEANTVADIERAIREAAGATPAELDAMEPVVILPSEEFTFGEFPTEAETLIDILDFHASRSPNRTEVWLYDDDEQLVELSFSALLEAAEEVAGGLRDRDLTPGQAVAIMLPTGAGFFHAFFGILLAGGVPVPLYPPVRPSQLEEHVRRQAAILRTAETPFMITVPEAKPVGLFLTAHVPALKGMVTVDELRKSKPLRRRPAVSGSDTAFLQFTSGSTGDPKGVVLTHDNLLANVRAIGGFVGPNEDDVFVSWLPMYHDMGLIGAVFANFYYGIPLVLMSPLAFLRRPERWLRAITRHKGTLTAAPNFAYEMCVKKVPEELLSTFDLSSWRLTLNGAEPISPKTMQRFAEHFAVCGFSPETMTPTFGLAECSLALAMTPVERAPVVDRVDRAAFAKGRAVPAEASDPDPLQFVSCGAPLSNHEVRIVDRSGRELGERQEGMLHFRGPSATSGYLHNPEATSRLIQPDGWLDSGDLAYLAEGELYVTGRIKDVILRAGRNLYPHELEELVGEVEGVRKGCVAVFGARREQADTEDLIVLAETRETDEAAHDVIRQRIREAAVDLLGTPPDAIVLAPPHTVLKTSSGKVRRSACRELYERGELLQKKRAVWLQLLRMSASGWSHQLRDQVRSIKDTLYAGRFWTTFVLSWGGNWCVVAVLPTRDLRWKASRLLSRAWFRLAGSKLTIEGEHNLQGEGPVVVASNHQSYLDGAVLAAVLPSDVAIVAKRELLDNFLTRTLLTRLGAIFVDRFDRGASAEGSRALPDALRSGRSIAVFPEGTCLRMPGLLPFHLGAFVAAVEAGVPLVPVTIKGSRNLLRPDVWFPRKHPVEVYVGEPIQPDGDDWRAAIRLRDAVRREVLAHVGEPDLANEDARAHLEG